MPQREPSTPEPGARRAFGSLAHYGLALLASGLTLGLAALIRRSVRPYVLPETFLAPVAVSTWYGGFGPGLVASLVVGAAGAYFLLPPFQSPMAIDASSFLLFGLCVHAAVTVGLLGGTARAARERAAASARAVEREQRLVALLAEASRLLGVSTLIS
jgi:K+-sensing histidine kinase KdpD